MYHSSGECWYWEAVHVWGWGIYGNSSVISVQYLCLNGIRNSTAVCPKLKVSCKTPPLISLVPSTFLGFINDQIIYLKSKISFLPLFHGSNLFVTIFYWILFCIPLSNKPPYFHFPGNIQRKKNLSSSPFILQSVHHFAFREAFQNSFIKLLSTYKPQAYSTAYRMGARVGTWLPPTLCSRLMELTTNPCKCRTHSNLMPQSLLVSQSWLSALPSYRHGPLSVSSQSSDFPSSGILSY